MRTSPVNQIPGNHLGDFNAAFFLRFMRAGTEVWGQRDVRVLPEWMLRWQGLLRIHIQGRSPDFSRIQGSEQVGFQQ